MIYSLFYSQFHIAKKNVLVVLVSFLLAFQFSNLNAQNLESIGNRQAVKLSGGFNVNTILYSASGIESRRDPFSYFLSGNLNFDIYELVIPVSFTYSNQSSSFQQPFNQYCLHPKFRSISADIGYTSATFSPYTLNGHVFNGISAKVAPEKRKLSYHVVYGRFSKAIKYDSLHVDVDDAAFRRMGYGTKLSYKNNSDYADAIFFYAKDDLNSIQQDFLPEELKPEENLVLSARFGKSILKKLFFEIDYSSSALSTDLRSGEITPDNFTIYNSTAPVFETRTSTSYNKAFKSKLSYKLKKYTFGVSYEQVDPEYRTLGTYYFNNDLENITGNATALLFQGKVNLALNAGVQRNDLKNRKISKTKRFIGDVNISYKATEKLNFSGTYSNVQTFTNIRSQFVDINQLTPYDNLDTLDFTQVSQSASFNTNYLIPSKDAKKIRQSINLNTNYQVADDTQGGVEQESGSQFIASNISYSLNVIPKNIGGALSFNVNQSRMAIMNVTTLGPTISIRKSLFDKKLKISGSSSFNTTNSNGENTGQFLNFRFSSNYSIKKKHRFQLSFTTVNRVSATKQFTEYTGSLSYNYSF